MQFFCVWCVRSLNSRIHIGHSVNFPIPTSSLLISIIIGHINIFGINWIINFLTNYYWKWYCSVGWVSMRLRSGATICCCRWFFLFFLLLSAHFRSMNAILTRTRMIASLIIIIIITKYSEQWHDMRLWFAYGICHFGIQWNHRYPIPLKTLRVYYTLRIVGKVLKFKVCSKYDNNWE